MFRGWKLDGNMDFSVKDTQSYIYVETFQDGVCVTHMLLVRSSFIWRVILDRLPMRSNLSCKGVEVNSLTCPVSYMFFACGNV